MNKNGKDGKDKYPLQMYIIVYEGEDPLCFTQKQDAMSFAREQMEDQGDDEILVGIYTLSGLKRLRTQVIEEDA